MTNLFAFYDRAAAGLARIALCILPLLARFTFAAVLLGYFWASAQTKLGQGFFGFLQPSDSAYIQIFPTLVEAAGYDLSQLGVFHWAIVTVGTLAELTLPLMIVFGLLTRLAALGMIGFTIVQSLTDVWGHGVVGNDLGRWFDAASGALIMDQRSLWILLLMTLIFTGAGPLSLDRLLMRLR